MFNILGKKRFYQKFLVRLNGFIMEKCYLLCLCHFDAIKNATRVSVIFLNCFYIVLNYSHVNICINCEITMCLLVVWLHVSLCLDLVNYMTKSHKTVCENMFCSEWPLEFFISYVSFNLQLRNIGYVKS